jgi:hypothetical protein
MANGKRLNARERGRKRINFPFSMEDNVML